MKYMLTARSGFTRGASWPLTDKALVVGRATDCDIVVQEGTVSRRHCQVRVHRGDLVLEDLGSQNLALVNGEPVVERHLVPGDVIAVGSAVFQVATLENRPPTPPLEMNEPETVTLRHAQLPFFRAQTAGRVDLPHALTDYVALFQFSRALSLCKRQDTLMARARAFFEERFKPAELLMLTRRGNQWAGLDAVSTAPADESLLEMMELAETEGRTTLAPAALPDEVVVVAPLRAFQSPVGMLVMRFESERAPAVEDQLVLVAAMAEVLGPFLDAMARCERMARVNARLAGLTHAEGRMVGRGAAMMRLNEEIRAAGRAEVHVLLLGETGTGKELAARSIHEASRRAHRPYVVLNCAAVPAELFESELFGHARGAFTGATGNKPGLMEEADGGTLFLDEVGDLSPANQARILRAIEAGTFRRVGETQERRADVRVVAATNRPLPGPGFRDDLYHRLAGMVIELPALRARTADIELLARHFLDQLAAEDDALYRELDEDAMKYLQSRAWTGNVRELKNFVVRAAYQSRQTLITRESLVAGERTGRGATPKQAAETALLPLEQVEHAHIRRALEHTGNNVSAAAKLLGISRSTLYNKLQALEASSGAPPNDA